MKIQLLESHDFPETALARLRALGPVITGSCVSGTHDVEAVFTRLATVLDAKFHALYPALRWIVSPTTGLDHIDLAYFESRGVEILSLRGRTEFLDDIHATAEHTIALALALLRRVPAAVDEVRLGRWDRYPHKGRELHGKAVMVYGYGRVGRQVADLYQAFGCHVRAYDVVTGRVPENLSCTPKESLPIADILSIHLPLNPETRGIIDQHLLSLLPPRAVVINTSRGEIVDQEALLTNLEARSLSGAALDVLQSEPEPLTPGLLSRFEALGARLLVTPHIAGFTSESLLKVEEHITELFLRAVDAQR